MNEKYEKEYSPLDFKVVLSSDEKIKCLQEIISRLKKILYVYDKALEEGSQYDYKVFCGGILIYVSSSNALFEGELVNVIVNLNAIINNDFEKPQIKRLVFETKNQMEFLLRQYQRRNSKVKSSLEEGCL